MTLLHIDNVSVQFPNANNPSLQNINYKLNQGDFIILLGSNGSGKSTLMNLIQKRFLPTSGSLRFGDGTHQVSVLNQNCSQSLFTSLTIYENYLLRKSSIHTTKRSFLKQYLLDYNPNLSDKLDVTLEQLSGGEKQALALALCLLRAPSLLLLDEHTSALDPKTSEQIMQLTQKMISLHSITCMLTTHDMDIALRYGNRILMLSEGKILNTFDTQEKGKLTKEQLVRCYY